MALSQMERNAHANTPPTGGAFPRRVMAWWLIFATALAFVAGGLYAVARGFDARAEVRDMLVAERITTPEDAIIPNAPVNDHATAHAQADAIYKHMLEATGGKTYAELDREDPARETAFSAAALRTSLLSAALAWHTADLVIGVGTFIAGLGIVMLLTLWLLKRPREA